MATPTQLLTNGLDPSVSSGRCIMVGAVAAILEVLNVCGQGEGSEVDPVGTA